jgi:Yip1 domain
MNRIAGIAFAGLGLVVAVLSIAKILPGLTVTGVVMIVVGGLIIGLSFIDRPDPEGVERESTPSTLANIFFSPSEVFKNLRRHPRFLVAMLLMSILSATYANLFVARLTAERIVNFTIDKTLEMSMVANNEEAKKNIVAGRPQALLDAVSPVTRTGQAISGFGVSVILFTLLALIFYVFSLAMGGRMNFWQAFSAGVYASFPIAVIKFILNTTLLYLKDPSDIHPILGQSTLIQDNLNFLVKAGEHPVLFTLLGSFSILGLYWIWLMATGVKNAGEKTTGAVGWSASLAVYFLLILLGVLSAALFPGFIS